MVAVSTMIADSVLGGVFKKLGSKSAEFGIDAVRLKANQLFRSLKNKRMLDNYLNKAVHKNFVFRTITKGDRDVYLDEIYHPVKIRRKNSRSVDSICLVDDGFHIDSKDCVTIVGLAGQGKTTMMRKLFLEELIREERVPFFITLRQFEYSSRIRCEDILLEHLTLNGMDCSLVDVVELLKTGRVVFYFDGFDEIRFSERNHALKMISSIHDRYGCSAIVTTRPETEITRQPGVLLYEVEWLDESDVNTIIRTVVDNDDASSKIIASLDDNVFLRNTISTPILIDILIVTSSLLCDKPNSIGDYYDHLFTALIHRHDLSKNYTREKKSNLGNKELEEIFTFFSFFSLIECKSDFTLETMHKYFSKACEVRTIDDSCENVCSDIVNGTNLIINDGYNNYIYIHRSIQEYFSARCVSLFNDEQKERFFRKHVMSDSLERNNVLSLYRAIDPIGFYKYYLIPFLESAGVNYKDENTYFNKQDISDLMDTWQLGVSEPRTESLKGKLAGKDLIGSSRGMTIKPFEDVSKQKFNVIMCLRYSLGLCGQDYKTFEFSLYMMRDCNDIIINYFDDLENEERISRDSTDVNFWDKYSWVSFSDIKDVIPEYDVKVLHYIYESYLSGISRLKQIIEQEYVKRVESQLAITSTLRDMGF
ncbi:MULTISPECIES: NACHT domain-containing protein [Serratia]|uniref:NACHT domain-containing protein n=1 Tax=Serratia TaxID=613 RepID=UPI00094B4860|nr:NACHT domain-containing protein [Serratia marcescens]